jgi:uncharacterized phage protein (TIGR01671 family)
MGSVIKFRFYNAEKKKMEVSRDEGHAGHIFQCWQSSNLLSFISPLMQFTGLHDKNGKEIYEGDIVRYTDHNGQASIKRVIYAAPCFRLQAYGNQVRTWHHHAEVIGNIHEHPELLEGK